MFAVMWSGEMMVPVIVAVRFPLNSTRISGCAHAVVPYGTLALSGCG